MQALQRSTTQAARKRRYETAKENEKVGIVEVNLDLVAQVDQKVLSQILKLITEKGARARYVKEARRSGVRLLRLLIVIATGTAAETARSGLTRGLCATCAACGS